MPKLGMREIRRAQLIDATLLHHRRSRSWRRDARNGRAAREHFYGHRQPLFRRQGRPARSHDAAHPARSVEGHVSAGARLRGGPTLEAARCRRREFRCGAQVSGPATKTSARVLVRDELHKPQASRWPQLYENTPPPHSDSLRGFFRRHRWCAPPHAAALRAGLCRAGSTASAARRLRLEQEPFGHESSRCVSRTTTSTWLSKPAPELPTLQRI